MRSILPLASYLSLSAPFANAIDTVIETGKVFCFSFYTSYMNTFVFFCHRHQVSYMYVYISKSRKEKSIGGKNSEVCHWNANCGASLRNELHLTTWSCATHYLVY